MICASIYCGPKYNFGNGSRIWIDNLDQAHGTLQYFKAYLEDPSIKKVFHNYSFDYHELRNEGITVQGFSCDTMHMARLWESSRVGKGSYSLESLSEELYIRKRPYKEIFGKPHIKRDGMQGKTIDVPPVIVAFLPFFSLPGPPARRGHSLRMDRLLRIRRRSHVARAQRARIPSPRNVLDLRSARRRALRALHVGFLSSLLPRLRSAARQHGAARHPRDFGGNLPCRST